MSFIKKRWWWQKNILTWRLFILEEHLVRITLASSKRKGLATRLYTDSPSRSRQEWMASTKVWGCQSKICKLEIMDNTTQSEIRARLRVGSIASKCSTECRGGSVQWVYQSFFTDKSCMLLLESRVSTATPRTCGSLNQNHNLRDDLKSWGEPQSWWSFSLCSCIDVLLI